MIQFYKSQCFTIIDDTICISCLHTTECTMNVHLKIPTILLPFTYVAIASGLSLSGSIVMKRGVTFGRLGILSKQN